MNRTASLRPLFLAIVGLAAMTFPAAAAETKSSETPIYARRNTWAETMVATRDAYQAFVAGQQKPQNPGGKAFTSDLLRGDTPAQRVSIDVSGEKYLRLLSTLEQSPGNCNVWGEARLIAKDGSQTPLSTLRPLFSRVGWGQVGLNENWQKQPLQVGQKKFQHGLWVHADSDLCYALDGKYQRFETWIGLDAARPSGAARFSVRFDRSDPLPTLWRRLATDFPHQSQWFQEDFRHANYLAWFQEVNVTQLEQQLVRQTLGQLGADGAEGQRELAQLCRAKVPPSDPRWLSLYARLSRLRDCATSLRQVWIIDLRSALERRIQELARAQVEAEDPRWIALQAAIERCCDTIPVPGFSLATLPASIENLAQAMPRRFVGHEELAKQAAERQRRWNAAVAALLADNPQLWPKSGELQQSVRDFRHAMLLGLRGMKEFLAVNPLVDLEKEWDCQYRTLEHDLQNRSQIARFASETYRGESLLAAEDRDPADIVLRRTAALLTDLKRTSAAATLGGLEKELIDLREANGRFKPENVDARYVLFAAACRLRRQVAARNPLLKFDEVLFVKHHRSTYNHMCDQYYGVTERPGGGLFVLAHPLAPTAQVRDVLAGSTVANGRLKGLKLAGGSFVTPSLSYDARQALFAYVECSGDPRQDIHTDPTRGHWSPGRSFHIFKANLDGTKLEQLTDGTWNDFAPCWLPNDSIAFITERRGGYLRCGRACPTYTLFDMAADGSNINCLSFHETNEWHPSVTNDGRIIYTRWDYVDRFGCIAHLPWITTLDGRDSRAVHGNFSPRQSRPDMEMNVRAIPASQKFIATAAPHHGQAYGSLVLIDPRVEDREDDAMAAVKRITPDVGFPESQGGTQTYGTAWPLSDDYYLCVYDAQMELDPKNVAGRGDYGIYLLDAFGNKELLYRDAEIGCVSPIPVQATERQPTAPLEIKPGARIDPSAQPAAAVKPAEATLAVVNVYNSLRAWPEGTKIKQLRIYQVLPMTVPSGAPPHETAVRIAAAGDSVVVARNVLGTVPVEEDGSAHFVAPANMELFFQTLDERGLAVQSMRSATYVHEGEHLLCQGCHEPKHRSPQPLKLQPLALRRSPSRIRPDVDGSNPFSYPRLVQPVLDRSCVDCHAKHADRAVNLAREPIQRQWYASYANLAPRYGFHDYGSGLVTTPGKFGARASKLVEILEKGHYGVKLSSEDLHRITLWLDSSSMFYGVYEKEGGEAQLRGEIARPTLQ